MPRAIWKGAISFGLVHIPVALVSATSSQGVDFDCKRPAKSSSEAVSHGARVGCITCCTPTLYHTLHA